MVLSMELSECTHMADSVLLGWPFCYLLFQRRKLGNVTEQAALNRVIDLIELNPLPDLIVVIYVLYAAISPIWR